MSPTATLEKPSPPHNATPPGDDGGGGGGGNGGSDSGGSDGDLPIDSSRLGLYIFLGSILMLFAGCLSVYVILRFSAKEWPPPQFPRLPRALWISTAIILASSVAAEMARRAARNRPRASRAGAWLIATLVLGTGFCALQVALWRGLAVAGLPLASHLYGTVFYLLTALHAAHVAGGLIWLILCALRAFGRPGEGLPGAVANCVIYWHFVGALWCALFVVLYLL